MHSEGAAGRSTSARGIGAPLSRGAMIDPYAQAHGAPFHARLNTASPEVFGRGLVTGTGRVNEAVSQPITEKASGTQLRG